VISLKRFYDLEYEFCQLAARMALSTSAPEIAKLLNRRMKIVSEACMIVNQLNAPEPRRCGLRQVEVSHLPERG
jgi:hypothetical protein